MASFNYTTIEAIRKKQEGPLPYIGPTIMVLKDYSKPRMTAGYSLPNHNTSQATTALGGTGIVLILWSYVSTHWTIGTVTYGVKAPR